MDFDFDKMAALASDPKAFEDERKRLIEEHLASIPEPQRAKMRQLQDRLDVLRKTMSPQQFMQELSRRLQENLEDLNDQLRAVVAVVESTVPPASTINRVGYSGSRFTKKP